MSRVGANLTTDPPRVVLGRQAAASSLEDLITYVLGDVVNSPTWALDARDRVEVRASLAVHDAPSTEDGAALRAAAEFRYRNGGGKRKSVAFGFREIESREEDFLGGSLARTRHPVIIARDNGTLGYAGGRSWMHAATRLQNS